MGTKQKFPSFVLAAFLIALACDSSFSGVAVAMTTSASRTADVSNGNLQNVLSVLQNLSSNNDNKNDTVLQQQAGGDATQMRTERLIAAVKALSDRDILGSKYAEMTSPEASTSNSTEAIQLQQFLNVVQNAFVNHDLSAALKNLRESLHTASRDQSTPQGIREFAKTAVNTVLPEQISRMVPIAISQAPQAHPLLASMLAPSLPESASEADKQKALEAEKVWNLIDTLLIGSSWDDMSTAVSRKITRQPFSLVMNSKDPIEQGKIVLDQLIGNALDKMVKAQNALEFLKSMRQVVSEASSSNIPWESATGNQTPVEFWKNVDTTLYGWPSVQSRVASPAFQNQVDALNLRLFQSSDMLGMGMSLLQEDEAGNDEASATPDNNGNSDNNKEGDDTASGIIGDESAPERNPKIVQFDNKLRPLIYGCIVVTILGLVFVILGRHRDSVFGRHNKSCEPQAGSTMWTAELTIQKFLCANGWTQGIVLSLLNISLMIAVAYLVFGMNLASSLAVSESKHRPQIDLRSAITDFLESQAKSQSRRNAVVPEDNKTPAKTETIPTVETDDADDKASLLELEGWATKKKDANGNGVDSDDKDYRDMITPEEKEKFVSSLAHEMEISGGDVETDVFLTLLKKFLHIPKRDSKLILKQFDANESGRVSVLEVRSALAQSTPILRMLFQRVTDLYGGGIIYLIGLVSLFGTNNSYLAIISAVLFIPLLLLFRMVGKYASSQQKENSGSADSTSDEMLQDLMNRKLFKLNLILGNIFLFSVFYQAFDKCKDPISMCSNGAWPICTTTGFPPTHLQCKAGGIACGWTANTGGDTMAICPSEKIPYGLFDNQQFSIIMVNGRFDYLMHSAQSPLPEKLQQSYNIGVAYGADLDQLLPEYQQYALIKNLKSDSYTYAYAEANKFTHIQNLLQLLPLSTLPNNNYTSIISSIALQLEESVVNNVCDPATLAGEFHIKSTYTNMSNADLRATNWIPMISPEASSHSNYRLCYKVGNSAVWNAVPNAWVVVGDLAGCSNADCSSSDFTDGMSSGYEDSFYYSLIIQTTIGYGDILPITVRAKMLTSIQCLMMLMISAM
eukprot:c13031_g1_i1.p1 GENE.c13031_g1_i1~~c13031_g1_i1.p1  ORF type:complete len:1080 (+),score=298.93 c13031_g1_i1:83-3322(+)